MRKLLHQYLSHYLRILPLRHCDLQRTFLEAASFGKPSIGGIFGGEADAIINGKPGYLCDGNDLNSIYETLLKTLKNDHYRELGINAFEFSKKFSWDKIVKKYIELI